MASGILEGDCRADPREVRCGTAEYRHLASLDRLKQGQRNLVKASGLEGIVTGLPTAKASTV